MNPQVFTAVVAVAASILPRQGLCWSPYGRDCDPSECSAGCNDMGALRWSCEHEGCLCTFTYEEGDALGESKGSSRGPKEQGQKKEDLQDSEAPDEGSEGNGPETTPPNKQIPKDKGVDRQKGPNEPQGPKRPKGPQGPKRPKGPKRKKTPKPPKFTDVPPPNDPNDQIPQNDSTSTEGQKQLVPNENGLQKELVPNEKGLQKQLVPNENGLQKFEQVNVTIKDLGRSNGVTKVPLARHADEEGSDASTVSGRSGDSGMVHQPIVVRSLEGPLSSKEVMDQIKQQKGDIPMKDINEFLKKGRRK